MVFCATALAPVQNVRPAQAQAGSAIAVFGGGALLEDVINQMQSAIYASTTNVEIGADRQIAHASNQAMILLREFEIAFSGELDKSLSAVDTQVLTAVEAVYSMQRGIEEGKTDLIHAIDGAALDVEAIIGQTIFADYPFLLKRVVNVSQLYNSDGQYTYELIGSGFGNSSVELTGFAIDDVELIDSALLSAPSQHVLQVGIGVADLEPLFDTSDEVRDRNIRALPVNLSFTRTSERPWWNIFQGDKVEHLSHEFITYLVPSYAGTLKLTNLGESFAWQPVETFEFNHRSVQNHCNEDCDDQKSYQCGAFRCANSSTQCVAQGASTPLREGDERLKNPRFSGGGHNQFDHNPRIESGGSCLTFSVTSGSHSVTYRVIADRERYLKQPDLVELRSDDLDVEFGRTYTVQVPVGTRLTNFEIDPVGSAQLVTGELTQGVNTNILRVISTQKIGENTVHNVTIHYPN